MQQARVTTLSDLAACPAGADCKEFPAEARSYCIDIALIIVRYGGGWLASADSNESAPDAQT